MSERRPPFEWRYDADAAMAEASERISKAKALSAGHTLDLSDLIALKVLPPLGNIPGLSELNLENTQIDSISRLSDVQNLVKLNISNTKVSNIKPLETLPLLEVLQLRNTSVSDISPLTSCARLTELDLRKTMVSKVSALAQLVNLAKLTLWDTAVTNISALASHPSITWLDIENCSVDDPSPITSLKALKNLYLGGTPFNSYGWLEKISFVSNLWLNRTNFSDLSVLTDWSELRVLYAGSSRIASVESLAKHEQLQKLDISSTLVSDIGPLRELKDLRYLDISNTRVSDLLPLASLVSLARRPSSGNRNGLSFENCPVADLILEGFSKLPEPKRTPATLNYLRTKIGLPLLSEDETTQVSVFDNETSVEQIYSALTQNKLGARSVRVGNSFSFASSAKQTDHSVVSDPLAQQLHSEVNRKLSSLLTIAERIKNQPGWTDLASTVGAFRVLLETPLSTIAARPAELWSLCVSLGAFVEQDNVADKNNNSFVMPLEPDSKRVLTDVVATGAVLARRFPSVQLLDEELREFHSLPDQVNSAAALILAAAQQRVLDDQSAKVTIVSLSSPIVDGAQSRKAHGRGLLSVRNLVLAAVGLVLTGYLNEFGSELAQDDILLQRARNWIILREKELIQAFEGAPPDTKNAIKEALRRAHVASDVADQKHQKGP